MPGKQQGQQSDDANLDDMLQELRVLLPGTQTLTAFLVILPFNSRFLEIQGANKLVYMATFLLSLTSLILFTAPAAQHRLQRPLQDRQAFKMKATKLMIAGLVPLAMALTLATFLVISVALDNTLAATLSAAVVGCLMLLMWWILPLRNRKEA